MDENPYESPTSSGGNSAPVADQELELERAKQWARLWRGVIYVGGVVTFVTLTTNWIFWGPGSKNSMNAPVGAIMGTLMINMLFTIVAIVQLVRIQRRFPNPPPERQLPHEEAENTGR